MMKHPLNCLLMLLFALLQCAAPLVHAHVNGQHDGDISPPALKTHHYAQTSNAHADCTVGQDESAAISLPHELQRDEQPSLPQATVAGVPTPRPVAILALPREHRMDVACFAPYRKSLPQAPPTFG